MHYKKKYTLLTLFSLFPLSCCSTNNTNLYQKNYQLTNSTYTPYIKQLTVHLSFKIIKNINSPNDFISISATGWIYSYSTNYYYIATNLHVGAALTYIGNKFIDSDNIIVDYTNSSLSYSIGFANSNDELEYGITSQPLNSNDYDPIIVYTTINDDDFNNIVNNDTNFYYNNKTYYGVSDLCIIRFYWDKSLVTTNFYSWLNSYKNTFDYEYLYDSYVNLKKYKFYSGGFPVVANTGINWTPLSDFTINYEVTSLYSNSWKINNNDESEIAALISFIDKDYILKNNISITDNDYSSYSNLTNFLSEGYTGYFYAYSDSGASGSLLATVINKKFYVVGIYWGISEFYINNSSKQLGSFDLFVSKEFNLVDSINNSISNDLI